MLFIFLNLIRSLRFEVILYNWLIFDFNFGVVFFGEDFGCEVIFLLLFWIIVFMLVGLINFFLFFSSSSKFFFDYFNSF